MNELNIETKLKLRSWQYTEHVEMQSELHWPSWKVWVCSFLTAHQHEKAI